MLLGHIGVKFALILGATVALSANGKPSLEILSVSGASSALISTSKHKVTIAGGMAGGDCAQSVDNSHTCNSCSSKVTACNHMGFCACNKARIHGGLVLRVNLKKDKQLIGDAVAVAFTPTGKTVLTPVSVANRGEFVDFTWSSVCAALGNSDCAQLGAGVHQLAVSISIDGNKDGILGSEEPSVTATFRLVNPGAELFDMYGEPSRDAISGFLPFGGEGVVFVENITGAGVFPRLSYGARAAGFRVFASETSVLAAGYDTATKTFDMVLNSTGRVFRSNEFEGLSNGIIYYFRAATVDEAGNVIQFVPANSKLPESCTTKPSEACPFSAMPNIPLH